MLKVESKYKICKRFGSGIFEQCQTQRYALSEQRAQNRRTGKRRSTLSDYGKQLLEKQKVRLTYGLHESQFARYAKTAMQDKTPAAFLHALLESRLDNVVYRLGLASTRRAARQMVSHGHILVNGKRMTIPSHIVKVNDTITVREGSRMSPLFTKLAESENGTAVPSWLSFDLKTLTAKVVSTPINTGEVLLDYPAVFEYYSR